MEHDNQYYIDELLPLTRLCYMLGAIRIYKNGDATGVLWRYWHPLTWLMIPCLFVIATVLYGVVTVSGELPELGITMGSYFKDNPDRLEWVK